MSFGIYKQGQGYWVRVLTAAFAGVLIIAAAAWAWGQAGTIRLPARSWTFSVNSVEGDMAPGDTIDFLYYNTDPDSASSPDTPEVLGTGTVAEYAHGKSATGTLVIDQFSSEDLRERANDAISLRSSGTGEPAVTAQIRGSTPTPVLPIEYLQAGAAGVVMLLGAILLYIFVAAKKQSVEFLIATDGEMKKVNWTTYREVKGSTIVVIAATFLIAGFLFGVDSLFARIFSEIGVLQR